MATLPVGAAPTVEIKARTQLALGRVRLVEGDQVEVNGQLVDKLTGEGLGSQKVVVDVGGREMPAWTRTDGGFTATLPAEPGQQQITLSYRGGASLEGAESLSVLTDPAKSPVVLRIVKVDDDPAGARLKVTAMAEDVGVAVPIAVALAPAPGSEAWGKPLARTPPILSGTEFTLTRAEAGGPGVRRIKATFAGDDTHQQASVDGTLELTSGTTTTMTVASATLAYENDLVVTGTVTDDDKHPVARAAVTLTSGDKRLAQGATADDGTYKFRVEAEILGAGAKGVQVTADPGQSYVRPSKSPPAVITIAQPQPVPVSYTVAAFVATAFAAGGFFVGRTKPWRRFRRPAPPAEQPTREHAIEQMRGGLVVAKPSIVSTLRRAADDGFSGVVRDTVRGRPVAQAVVRLILGDAERETRTVLDGSFAIEKLAPGEWSAEVAAPGHVTETFGVTIPHRGELRGVRVDLVPVRERVFQLYRRAAEPVLPESRLWGIWSPRQIVDHVRSKRPSPALAELTDFVEEIYFSGRLAAETILEQASERVDRAVRERTRRPN
jgi:hypothetical protein